VDKQSAAAAAICLVVQLDTGRKEAVGRRSVLQRGGPGRDVSPSGTAPAALFHKWGGSTAHVTKKKQRKSLGEKNQGRFWRDLSDLSSLSSKIDWGIFAGKPRRQPGNM